MFFNDTIAAIATPPGQGGIGIVRISGDNALTIAREIFEFENEKEQSFKNRYLHYGKIVDDGDNIIDEVLISYMQAPNSYTTEDVVEINCHGGVISLNMILKQVIKKGARLAQPGEFTKRAFLNGRIDLVQAEAIMDLISAQTERSAEESLKQMEGGLSQHIKSMRDKLLDFMAHIEVTIDYPEEDIGDIIIQGLKKDLEELLDRIDHLLSTANEGKLIRQGIKVVIVGKSNVGKSSLMNALVREERAIVTDIPGTTRDVIEESINIKGVALRILDTAGIRDTLDQVEKIGIDRSRKNIHSADLIITVLDASSSLEPQDKEILGYLKGKKALVVLNKIDKPSLIDIGDIEKGLDEHIPVIETSLTMGKGIDIIEDSIYSMFFKGDIEISNEAMITNTRHHEALIRTKDHLLEALDGLGDEMPLDIISIDLRDAVDSLGSITGESVTEDLVNRIFSEFCLGK